MPLVHAEQLDTTPPQYLVEGMLPLTGAGFFWGPSRYGKSLLVNGELALAVANGTEFFGRRCAQGAVAICLGEGLYDAGVRLRARLAREQSDRESAIALLSDDTDERKRMLESLPAYDDTNMYYVTEPFVLPFANAGEPTESLRAAVSSLRQIDNLALVVLDALSDFSPSLSISNDASANRSVQGLKFLARSLDACVLAVAHPTRAGNRMLGAGRLFNAADFVVRIQPEEGYGGNTSAGPTGASVVCEKNKYGAPFDAFGYTIESCEYDDFAQDTDGNLTGDTYTVRSATVRPNAAVVLDRSRMRAQRKPLPQYRTPDEPRKRTGVQ